MVETERLLEYQARAEMLSPGNAPPIYLGRQKVLAGALKDERSVSGAQGAVDQELADSIPASDPPPCTRGIASVPPERHAATRTSPLPGPVTFGQGLASLAGASGICLLVPFVILIVGLPVALAVRAVLEAVTWLTALALK